MKIFILSKGRADSISTHKLFDDYDYKIVLHNEDEKTAYLKNDSISPEKLIVSGAPFGVAHQRQWIQDNLVEKGEWYVSLDDNIRAFQAVPLPHYAKESIPVQIDPKSKELFETPCSAKTFLEICGNMAAIGEIERAYNIGFGTTPNFFFRGRKLRYVGYVISKACVRKNVGTPFELEAQSMEDYAYTAETLLRYGKVLINNYVFPVAGHYEKGGIGTYAERLPHKIKDSAYLMKKYPGLFRNPKKKTADSQGELMIRFTTLAQVEQWRAFMRTHEKANKEKLGMVG